MHQDLLRPMVILAGYPGVTDPRSRLSIGRSGSIFSVIGSLPIARLKLSGSPTLGFAEKHDGSTLP